MLGSGSGLVAGVPASATATQRVRVVRSYFDGVIVRDAGEVLDLPRAIARGLLTAGKVEVVPEAEPSAPAEE